VQSIDGTDVLADSEGRTLYSAEVERDRRIRCTGACESFWDPVEASATDAESASGTLSWNSACSSARTEIGQLTLDGRPL
jgi:predicted lipoprotein with Yx(FWY)xxD motif